MSRVANASKEPGVAWSTLLFCLIIGGFHFEDVAATRLPDLNVARVYLWNIPVRDIVLVGTGVVACIFGREVSLAIGRVRLSIAFIWILVHTLIGITGPHTFAEMRSDLRVILWFVGGVSVGALFVRSWKPDRLLQIVTCTGLILIMEASMRAGVIIGPDVERITHPSIYLLGVGVFACIALLLEPQRGMIRPILVWLALGVLFYTTVVRGVTRSTFISILCLVVCCYLTRLRRLPWAASVVAIVVLCIATVATLSFNRSIQANESRYDRLFMNPLKNRHEELRYQEIQDFFDQRSAAELVSGAGLGSSLSSSVYRGGIAINMHVGLMNIWLKFGVFPFLYVAYLLYVYVPISYLMSALRLGVHRKAHEAAIRHTFPAFVVWAAQLATSGGFTEGNSLWGGIAVYLFYHLRMSGSPKPHLVRPERPR